MLATPLTFGMNLRIVHVAINAGTGGHVRRGAISVLPWRNGEGDFAMRYVYSLRRIAFFLVAAGLIAVSSAWGQMPWVWEEYDVVAVESGSSSQLEFWRGQRLIARRPQRDDMLWSTSPSGFRVSWDDWCCQRVIDFSQLVVLPTAGPSTSTPWWSMDRLATDLRSPD